MPSPITSQSVAPNGHGFNNSSTLIPSSSLNPGADFTPYGSAQARSHKGFVRTHGDCSTNAFIMRPMIKDPFARLGLDREVLTVSQLNGRARVLLEDVFSNIWVEGEISNLARPASGHVYFTLKDSGAQVRCALFRQNEARVRQALKDGLAVKVRGKVSLFEGRGDYQLILDTVEPAGDGSLRLAFEALKEKLSAEGLFAAERKVALPSHPKRIGIVSSP